MTGLKFCMVTTFYPPHNFGGDGITVQRFARALVRRGHRVTVVYDADAHRVLGGTDPPHPLAEDDGVEVVPLTSRLGLLSVVLTQQLGRPVLHAGRLRRLLETGGFDVIHFHNVSLIGGGGVLAMGHAIKLYTAHEHWLVCPTHVLWRHGREPCDARACLRCTLHHGRPPQLWRATGYLERQAEHVDRFIALSEFSRAKHREMGFDRPMEVIPPFLPTAATASVGGERPQERPYFLFVGRLERFKGVAEILPLFREYTWADLLIAGEGGDGEMLRVAAADLPHVRFLGKLDAADIRRHVRHAVALIVPSLGYETFGLVLIEAFREETPVIARRIGPFPEIVEACGGGQLYSTPAELLAAMRRFQGDRQYRDACGRAGRQGFHERWSEDAVLPKYLGLVQRLGSAKGLLPPPDRAAS